MIYSYPKKIIIRRLVTISIMFALAVLNSVIWATATKGQSKWKTYKATYTIYLENVERTKPTTIDYGQAKFDSLSFEDKLIKILWSVRESSININLQNKNDFSLKISWDDVAYVDDEGKTHRVIHGDVKFSEKDRPQPSTIVIRKGILEDVVIPSDYITFEKGYVSKYNSSPGYWSKRPLLRSVALVQDSTDDFAVKQTINEFSNLVKSNIGKRLQVLIPIQAGNTIIEYIFTFQVRNAVVTDK
jgi:hypothetical protein